MKETGEEVDPLELEFSVDPEAEAENTDNSDVRNK